MKYKLALENNIEDAMVFYSFLDKCVDMYIDGDDNVFVIEVL